MLIPVRVSTYSTNFGICGGYTYLFLFLFLSIDLECLVICTYLDLRLSDSYETCS